MPGRDLQIRYLQGHLPTDQATLIPAMRQIPVGVEIHREKNRLTVGNLAHAGGSAGGHGVKAEKEQVADGVAHRGEAR